MMGCMVPCGPIMLSLPVQGIIVPDIQHARPLQLS
jgi:hypothetical protein